MSNSTSASRNWVWYLVAGIVLTFLAAVVVALFKNSLLLELLRDKEYARGLITFFISLGTIVLAFILVISALFSAADDDKFRRAREVFAALMGVLGTIVGFYFGIAEDGPARLEVSEVRLHEVEGKAELIAYITGGRPPYRYTVTFDGDERPPLEGRTSDGWILKQLADPMPQAATVEVVDRDDQKAVGRTPAEEPQEE